MNISSFQIAVMFTLTLFGNHIMAQVTDPDKIKRFNKISIEWEERGLAKPFNGITIDGNVQQDLFKLRSTGVTTEPVRRAAQAFIESLDESQQTRTQYAIEDDEWRKWMNQHFYIRQGVGFDEMDEKQRKAAFDLMGASLSVKGLKLSKDIMKLNHTLGEINDNFKEYGEWLYWMTIMGVPSDSEPCWFYSLLEDKESQLKWAKLNLERIKNQSKFTPVDPETEAFANYLVDQYKKALPIYQDLANTQINNWGPLSLMGIIYAKMNNRKSAEVVIQELKTNDGPLRKGRYKYALARIYSALNEKELATEYMKRAFNDGLNFGMGRYDYDNELIPLHGYPAYEEFVKPKG